MDKLIERVSREFELPPVTVQALLDLESEFPNMSARSAKSRLTRRVEEVISAGLGSKD
ncbi:hypothetical protein NKJ10_25315 [Mesorhizobium sp. M0204]|uniref:hypothetical protein n=1 Tax=Mesorhizobium sp. M0204 TaxID=2956913 RepID=UPI00333E0A83